MKNLRKITREYYLRQIIACWLVFYMMFGMPMQVAMANIGDSGGGTVVAGSADITAPGGTADAYIDLLTSQTVINWPDFDTVTGQLVEFGGGVGSAVLNRIVAGGATNFYGNLQALGIDVFIVNTRGFIQGPDSFMQARTLVISGFDILNEDFLAGVYDFKKNAINPFGDVIGDVETLGGGTGAIEAENIALIGKNVINRGVLRTTAPGGCVVMAAGESVYLQDVGSNVVVEVDIPSNPDDYVVDNGGGMATESGAIDATDSRVVLAAGDIYSTAIEGVESLRAESYSDVEFTGDIQATGDVEITAGAFPTPHSIYPPVDPWTEDGSADLQNVSAGGTLSVVTNHGLTINGSAESGEDMTLISDYDFWGGDDLTVTGTLTSGGNMHIEGVDITLGGDATATGDMDILAHGWWYDGELGNSSLTEGTDVTAMGDLIAGGSISVTGNNLSFGHDVRANGGDLTLTARTAEDIDQVGDDHGDDNGWGDIEVGSGGTLYARDDIHIIDYSKPGTEPTMQVIGEDALTLTAETGTVYSDADIYTSAVSGSDAVASVTINTGSTLTVNYNITADAEVTTNEDPANNASATITIDSGGDVIVEDMSIIQANTFTGDSSTVNAGNLDAKVDIGAAGDVTLDGSYIGAYAHTGNGSIGTAGNLTATVEIGAGGDILDNSNINAYAHTGDNSSGNVGDIATTIGLDAVGNVAVSDKSFATSYAYTGNGSIGTAGNLTATIEVDAGGNVALGSDTYGWGDLYAYAFTGMHSSGNVGDITATITVDAVGDVTVSDFTWVDAYALTGMYSLGNAGNLSATTTINAGGNVDVLTDDSQSRVWAYAYTGGDSTGDVGTAEAAIDIDAGGNVTVDNSAIVARATNAYNDNTANIVIEAGGNVDVIAEDGGTAEIRAATSSHGETTNTSDVLICADGTVTVSDTGIEDRANTALIGAVAENGYINDASVGIGAGEGVVVIADNGTASISSLAQYGHSNTAETLVCTTGGVYVIGEYDGEASIISEALYGDITDAYVGICAVDDVLVLAGTNPDGLSGGDSIIPEGTGGTATIEAEAMASCMATEESTASADVTVVSHEGGVAVIDVGGETPETAGIIAEAYNAYSNTASVGVAAYGDLLEGLIPEDSEFYDLTGGLGLGVLVAGFGNDSDAGIFAYAHNGEENTADVVVCTPDIAAVIACADGFAQIKSRAGAFWGGDGEATNTATTQVYAGEVAVYVPTTFGGQGIWASAADTVSLGDSPHVDSEYSLTVDDSVDETVLADEGDSRATLIIDTYDNVVDCPDCPPPPCPQCPEEEDEIFTAAAPLPSEEFPVIEGCPALMQAAALELGIGSETIQVAIERGLASNPNIQPCEACASIVNYARVLQDVDGARMAAMLQIFNEMAPAGAPFTPEMAASIATAFSERINDDTMPQYATAMEYIDAFVGYVLALDEGLGSPVGDSVTFVMDKYGDAVISSDNPNIGAFISVRLEQMGG